MNKDHALFYGVWAYNVQRRVTTAEYAPEPQEVTLVTHLAAHQLPLLATIALQWNGIDVIILNNFQPSAPYHDLILSFLLGPVSAAVYVQDDDSAKRLAAAIDSPENKPIKHWVSLHAVFPRQLKVQPFLHKTKGIIF